MLCVLCPGIKCTLFYFHLFGKSPKSNYKIADVRYWCHSNLYSEKWALIECFFCTCWNNTNFDYLTKQKKTIIVIIIREKKYQKNLTNKICCESLTIVKMLINQKKEYFFKYLQNRTVKFWWPVCELMRQYKREILDSVNHLLYKRGYE